MWKKLMWILLIFAYAVITIFGFLSGMFSESLIGSVHPMADGLAQAMIWFGAIVSLSPMACLLIAGFLMEKPVIRRIVLVLPMILLAVQLLLGCVADML